MAESEKQHPLDEIREAIEAAWLDLRNIPEIVMIEGILFRYENGKWVEIGEA